MKTFSCYHKNQMGTVPGKFCFRAAPCRPHPTDPTLQTPPYRPGPIDPALQTPPYRAHPTDPTLQTLLYRSHPTDPALQTLACSEPSSHGLTIRSAAVKQFCAKHALKAPYNMLFFSRAQQKHSNSLSGNWECRLSASDFIASTESLRDRLLLWPRATPCTISGPSATIIGSMFPRSH